LQAEEQQLKTLLLNMLGTQLFTFLLLCSLRFSEGFDTRRGLVKADEPSWPCPVVSEIEPCLCSTDSAYSINIDCSAALDGEEVASAMSAVFPFDDCADFTIIGSKSGDEQNVTLETFGGKSFKSILIENTRLVHVSDDAFSEMFLTLTELSLVNNEINLFPFEILPQLRITDLDLSNNKLNTLPSLMSDTIRNAVFNGNANLNLQIADGDTFGGLTALITLKLIGINLTTEKLSQNLFISNAQLKELYLNNNELTVLDTDSINPQPQAAITKLYLNDNNINEVKINAITGVAPECELNMINNQIKYLYIDGWKPIFDQITTGEILLDSNPLLCGCDMDWIVVNQVYLDTISVGTTCGAGEETLNIHSLDVGYFINLCNNAAYETKGLSYSELVKLKNSLDH